MEKQMRKCDLLQKVEEDWVWVAQDWVHTMTHTNPRVYRMQRRDYVTPGTWAVQIAGVVDVITKVGSNGAFMELTGTTGQTNSPLELVGG